MSLDDRSAGQIVLFCSLLATDMPTLCGHFLCIFQKRSALARCL